MTILKEIAWGSLEIFRLMIQTGPIPFWMKRIDRDMRTIRRMKNPKEMNLEEDQDLLESIRLSQVVARMNRTSVRVKRWMLMSRRLGRLQKSLNLD